jgi:hypothetical protein
MKHKGNRRRVVKDLRRQLSWIEEAITDGDSDWLETYANQLAGSAYLLIDEEYLAERAYK